MGRPRFAVERLGRFDQQVTSRFHRDGGPDASLLLLGYEPSPVRSRLFVADACRAAADTGLSVTDFLAAHNPMFPAGEQKLTPYVTELELPPGEAVVVIVNNCLVPGAAADRPLGLLHKAIIPVPDPAAKRVINSVGATPAGGTTGAPKTGEEVESFLTRDDLD